MCTAGSVIALQRREKMLIVGIIGRGARSQPLPGKAYIEFHSGPKIIKMKYIETCYSTHKLLKASVFLHPVLLPFIQSTFFRNVNMMTY